MQAILVYADGRYNILLMLPFTWLPRGNRGQIYVSSVFLSPL